VSAVSKRCGRASYRCCENHVANIPSHSSPRTGWTVSQSRQANRRRRTARLGNCGDGESTLSSIRLLNGICILKSRSRRPRDHRDLGIRPLFYLPCHSVIDFHQREGCFRRERLYVGRKPPLRWALLPPTSLSRIVGWTAHPQHSSPLPLRQGAIGRRIEAKDRSLALL
jgi:hypothetical protein